MKPTTRIEHLPTTVHGRYLVRPAADRESGALLIGCHGYGEGAAAHLAELERLAETSVWSLVAIQALHPFYNSRTGEVVASWMTRLDRELAIADNIRYVSQVVERARTGLASDGPLVYAGFSQGTAMAYRAAAGAGHRCHGVVALGGDVPPELAELDLTGFPPVLIGRGEADDWYSEEKLAHDRKVLTAKGIDCRVVRFAGGHEWTDAFRAEMGFFLEGIRDDFQPPPVNRGA